MTEAKPEVGSIKPRIAGVSRDTALRSPWWLAGGAYVLLFIYTAPKLTTDKIETARAEGIAAKASLAEESESDAGSKKR